MAMVNSRQWRKGGEMKKRKKGLVGWTFKDWEYGFSFVRCGIDKVQAPIIFRGKTVALQAHFPIKKVRITIEEV